MFEPERDLVRSFELSLPTGELVAYDQSLWGKVIEIREIHMDGGRYYLDDYWATARLRQMLEVATMDGRMVRPLEPPLDREIAVEVRNVIFRLYGEANEW